MELSLWFSKDPLCELIQVRFKHPAKAPKISYRGKALMYQQDAGLFQWTSAVKAFAFLALGTRHWALGKRGTAPYSLSGEKGSAAAALDFAISKPTSWIIDMFGRESSGKSFARLVFKRENSEQKRPGPVRIMLTSQLFESNALKIFYDGREITSAEEILLLQEKLSIKLENPKASSLEEQPKPVFKASWFKSVLNQEIKYALTETHLLDAMTIQIICEKVVREKPHHRDDIKKLSSSLIGAVSPEAIRYKQKPSSIGQEALTSVACSPIAVGALCIFHHLRDGGYKNLSITASYPSTSSIIESGDISHVDAAVLTWGAGLKLLRSKAGEDFQPVMLLPRSTFGLIVPPGMQSLKDIKRILLGADPDGYPIEFLRRAKELSRLASNVETVPANASEIMSHLTGMADAAIIGFPLSSLVAKKYKAQIFWEHDDVFRLGDNILFLRNTISPQHIISSIRQSWFALLDDIELLQKTSEKIFSEISFINYLYRQAALYRGEGMNT